MKPIQKQCFGQDFKASLQKRNGGWGWGHWKVNCVTGELNLNLPINLCVSYL